MKIIKTNISNLTKLQATIGYEFNNIELLIEALSHPSINCSKKRYEAGYANYEKLEFFGDSILNMIIAEIIYTESYKNEGEMAKRRNLLICKKSLAKIAASINLGEFIIMSKGEELEGGKTNLSNLENSLEAIIASIYIDSDFANTKKIVKKLWQSLLKADKLTINDPKSFLQEWSQSLSAKSLPIYKIIKNSDDIFEAEVLIDGFDSSFGLGSSKKEASTEAAKKFIEKNLKNTG